MVSGAWMAAAALLPAAALEIRNDFGSIRVEAVGDPDLQVAASVGARPARDDEMVIERKSERIVITAKPSDVSAPMDFTVRLPLGFDLEAQTKSGEISIVGMVHRARLYTDTGLLFLKIPWAGARLQLDADQKPAKVSLPSGRRFLDSTIDISGGKTLWRLRDNLAESAIVYGSYRVRAGNPKQIVLEDFDPPPDWPLKFHWEASKALETILSPASRPRRLAPTESLPESETGAGGEALFRSDVRMVNLVLAVNDRSGNPVTDLEAKDFTVVEDGEPQQVAFAGSDEAPFNLAVLLDLSGSTRPDRAPMQAAVEGFIRLAGPNDRVAVYALAGGMFHVVSRLTSDRSKLLEAVQRLPEVSGASPLYDAITLAYAEELHQRPGERNALIVISDGIDNQVSHQEAPSSVKFKRLVQAGEEMNAIIYPIFLLSGQRFGRDWSEKARKRMEELAAASGGRVFPAGSIGDLAPVFPQVEAELRSVYSVAYYPKNQDFDGAWRKVDVQVNRSDAILRARPGYYAR